MHPVIPHELHLEKLPHVSYNRANLRIAVRRRLTDVIVSDVACAISDGFRSEIVLARGQFQMVDYELRLSCTATLATLY